jgi:nicotinamide riboside kinase
MMTPLQKLEAAIAEYLDSLRDSNFPKKSKTLVINLIGGPGIGKSILASDTFSSLKKEYITCEISHEYIKRKLREKAVKVTQDQIYIFGKQQFQLFGMIDDVLVIVTDSPILLSAIYPIDQEKCPLLRGLILKEYLSYNNMMYFIERDENAQYENEGRYQDLEGAKKVDMHVKKFLEDNKIEYHTIKGIGSESLSKIVQDVKKHLSYANQ